tara:strand:- start:964 stop:1554 length:591 start_codon:yes stop_codon:yes gene_type:complete
MSAPNLFFPTPVWVIKVENHKETNERIYNYIKKLNNEDQSGIVRSNIKGWHSKDFNMKDDDPKSFIELISPYIEKSLQDMNWDIVNQKVKIGSMWAIINKGGAENARHNHGGSALSAAYYVRAPQNCGEIVFYDPRPAPVYYHPENNKPNQLNATINSVNPVEGGLVLFPSYLDHSVNANKSDQERIVISFNVSVA